MLTVLGFELWISGPQHGQEIEWSIFLRLINVYKSKTNASSKKIWKKVIFNQITEFCFSVPVKQKICVYIAPSQ